ncbi:MAG: outer membrane protein assembly factor BamB [Gammaproteobacteria bacterium]|nr:outer membrane protein assembly factor BamB [Gammaproteobacteria bacterium]NNF61656.1 outer membrane protein assembly factor BamB [Gammaproteobacteria bacterium]NNM20538.1 outer membrane protein assembly factor BamB [Gammaproteobacteria bacterium]
MKLRLLVLALLALVALQGCLGGNRKKNPEEQPVELTAVSDGLQINRLWSAKLGGSAEHLALALAPASDGSRVYAASHGGTVSAFDIDTGNRQWSVDTKLALSAGPGYGDGMVVVGSADGDVLAFDTVTGGERWRQSVTGELLATPVVYGNVVILRSVNGVVYALDARDGKLRWNVAQSVPRLSLRGVGQPAAGGDRVIVGFDNGRVVAYRLRDGAELWQAPLATPSGRTELERLTDVDSNVLIVGEEVYVAGFQSRGALLQLTNGQAAWAEEMSSVGGLAADWNAVYSTGGDGSVFAVRRSNGLQVWQQDALLRRGITGPAVFGTSVVVGDFEGYLHWLRASDGAIIGRARAGKSPIAAPPLVAGERLFVQDEAGVLYAYAMPGSS